MKYPTIIAFLVLSACAGSQKQKPVLDYSETSDHQYTGIDTQHFSQTIRPGDDFYTFVNEGWLAETELPKGASQLSSFNQLANETRSQTEQIIWQTQQQASADPIAQRVAALLSSHNDVVLREQLGLQPLLSELEQIKNIGSKAQVAEWMADPRSNALVDIFIWLDAKNSSRHVVHMDQISSRKVLGMGQKSYYTNKEKPYTGYQQAYINYIEKTLSKAGYEAPQQLAAAIYALEEKLAEGMWEPAKIRDRKANYHPMTVQELHAYAPGFPWAAFLQQRGLGQVNDLILGTDSSVQHSAAVFAETPLSTWKGYLAFHWVRNHRYLLSQAVADDAFEFYGKTLSGLTAPMRMEERGIRFVNRNLGQQVGQLYVAQHFSAADKQQIELLIDYVKRAFAEKLAAQDWMDADTKQQALYKLSHMQVKLAYPEAWRDRSALQIKANDLVGNHRRIQRDNWRLELANLDKPYPDGTWWMNPQTIDASFSPQLNRITFPAGILQAPFFDPDADVAVNFGAIGAVIGHEMGHGFDDQGSQFDAHGMLNNWWSAASKQAFKDKSKALVKQYNAFYPLPDVSINGQQTLGENMADLIGVSIAHRAYEIYLQDHPKADRKSGMKNFFYAWAQANRTLWNEEALKKQLLNGHHTPGKYRVNGVVRNIDAWYETFGIKAGEKMYLPSEERVRLW